MRLPATLRWFLHGQPRYSAVTPWPAWLAVLTTVLILVSAQILAALAFPFITGIDVTTVPALRPGAASVDKLGPTATHAVLVILLLSQIGIIVMTLIAALRGGIGPVLQLNAPEGGWSACLLALLMMIPLLAIFNGLAYLIAPDKMAEDFRFFLDLARSDARLPTTLAIGVGAPASEELLFRGFLLTALAATRIGYWRSAIAATSAWTLLHWGYSWVGLLEVFLIGVYFSWLLWRTGSLWPLCRHPR